MPRSDWLNLPNSPMRRKITLKATIDAPVLATAPEQLDRAVYRCYRKEPFASDRQRIEYLFTRYEQLTAPLALAGKRQKKGIP